MDRQEGVILFLSKQIHNQSTFMTKHPVKILLNLVALIFLASCLGFNPTPTWAETREETEQIQESGDSSDLLQYSFHLPIVMNELFIRRTDNQRVNSPYFTNNIEFVETAIFWLGEVNPTDNYADVRVGYTETELFVHVAIFDRLLWYDKNPSPSDLSAWDAVSLYLDMEGNQGSTPDKHTYRFDGQLSWWEDRSPYQNAYQGSSQGWEITSLPFTTDVGHRGNPNDNTRDSGWRITYRIPFTSFGLSSPPVEGVVWGLGVAVHDRDDASGTPIADQTWPAGIDSERSRSWGQLAFGLPTRTQQQQRIEGSVSIRHGLNGANVVDGEVGGHTNCGANLNRFTQWGEANYAHIDRINIQNQYDVSDFPCFSKYYINFPLDMIPQGKVISSATLTLYQFGNAGGGEWGTAPSSLIQVFTVSENWQETLITWNNAPQAVENQSRSWVPWLSSYPGAKGIPRTWDVTMAVSEAYLSGDNASLALYSADSARHSGKYFWSSDYVLDESRPTLSVTWTDP